MAFKKAERTQLYLRCALFGPSGSGKTMTALRMAKGIADKMGMPFAVIDTESRSASKYADRIPFDVDDLTTKTVDHYLTAMDTAAKAGYKVLVIDSLSHCWRELTEEADRIAQSSNSKNSFSAWAKVTPKQKRLVDAILNYPGHLITTMRSKTEWVIGEGKNGKAVPEKMGLAPEQGKGIEYEFDLLIELNQRHEATITKDRTGKFQDETIEKPGEEFGVALYEWLICGNAVAPAAVETPTAPATKPAPAVKGKTAKEADIKERRNAIVNEIGDIVTSKSATGAFNFSEDEKEEARQLIKATTPDENGVKELGELKDFLATELAKRNGQAALPVTDSKAAKAA